MSFKQFFDAYLTCAFWSSADDDGTPLDSGAFDESADLRETLRADAQRFYDQWSDYWDSAGIDDSQAGHDFWLTRNRHGAGFWGRGLGQAGEVLTDACRYFGGVDLYVGDDGKIYAYGPTRTYGEEPAQ